MALELNGSTGVSLVQDGVVTAADLASGAAAGNLGFTPVAASDIMGRNRIINGDMRIDQRNAGASVTIVSGGANYAIDRFATLVNTSEATTCSIQRVSDAPANFSNSYKFTTGTGAAGTGSQQARFYQPVEGLNVDDFAWGTANAKTVTLSFYVKASQSGTFGGCLRNDGGTRSYPFTYSISATNTWEYKTVTIPGDTTGTWLKDNGIGILVFFDLGSGPNFLGTPNSWAAANYLGATGGTSTVAVSSATWQITGVQLEVGSVATPFERRPYGAELALCQRYYWRVNATTGADMGVGFNAITTASRICLIPPVQLRTNPAALETTGTATDYSVRHANTTTTCSVVPAIFGNSTVNNLMITLTVASGLTAGQGCSLRANGTAFLGWSAEL